MTQKKILVVSHACIRAINRELFRQLADRGLDIEILLPEGLEKGGEWIVAEPERPGDPPLHHLPMHGTNNRLFHYDGLAPLLARIAPDVIYAETDTASRLAIELGRWCRRYGKKLVVQTNENLSWSLSAAYRRGGFAELPAALAKQWLNFRSRGRVDHVLVTSDEAKSVFARHGLTNASVMPMGTDRQTFRHNGPRRRAARAELGIAPDEQVIAYFGRMVPEKGINTLVRALAEVRDLPFRLILNKFESNAGHGAQIHALIDELGLRNRVIEAESRHGAIAALMNAADVAVLPSRTTRKWVEQFGRVVPEVMSCGALMLVSDSGAPKELVGDRTLVFPEGDFAALAAMLRQLAADPALCLAKRKQALRHAHRTMSMAVQTDIVAGVIG